MLVLIILIIIGIVFAAIAVSSDSAFESMIAGLWIGFWVATLSTVTIISDDFDTTDIYHSKPLFEIIYQDNVKNDSTTISEIK